MTSEINIKLKFQINDINHHQLLKANMTILSGGVLP